MSSAKNGFHSVIASALPKEIHTLPLKELNGHHYVQQIPYFTIRFMQSD